ncbi:MULTISPECIES: ShlB/FhaC/HecB family hemolysin secretion/activation protein [Leptolyngbya]|uniref:ShlB/FhaC/HecB family hemolysin secretion/activation protein n=1 Tax=Leptolyngbya TaxID=47251 RepID=UPI0016898A2B|nr:ShlB/FhaC/HecB family hemolysin secretion/activation protein [Leptolyngbya sp. FACHB-1624]MBD1858014.1 ShlB/FhaC/HecB family hemolysin secretion/activation protein [Leptolyngbya sp. FACHB-1624]
MQNKLSWLIAPILVLAPLLTTSARSQSIPRNSPIIRDGAPEQKIYPQGPAKLPPIEQLLPPPPISPTEAPRSIPDTIFVKRFEIVGSTIFSAEDFAKITEEYTNQNLSFTKLQEVRSRIAKLYVDRKYLTSAAVLPPQTLEDSVVKIQIIEGTVDEINVVGTRRLNPSYIRSRVGLATQKPLNVDRLLEQLRVLQLDPLLTSISADLQAGTKLGSSILQVTVGEAKTLAITPSLDNARSPSVGTLRRQLEVSQANLLGFGDSLKVGYSNTNGSNSIDLNYTVPLNPRNGTLRFAYGRSRSTVIEKPFDVLDITSRSRYYELTYRQPIVQRPTTEFAMGLTFSRQESETELGIDNIGPFRLSPGADEQGRTRISALRFFQDYVHRSDRQVFAARSQFSFGVGLFNATQNNDAPDSHFFAWRGQAQWTRLLARDTLLLVRGDLQLSDRSLVPLEQIGIGGSETVRGYRQDALLTDNGLLFSTELRLPILRTQNGILQLTPFVDLGAGWNRRGNNPETNTLVGTGLGLLWRQGDNFSARLDWGIPLVSLDSNHRSLQENGIYFSIRYSPSF